MAGRVLLKTWLASAIASFHAFNSTTIVSRGGVTIFRIAEEDVNVIFGRVVLVGFRAKNPLLRRKIAIKCFVAIVHVLFFDVESSLEG